VRTPEPPRSRFAPPEDPEVLVAIAADGLALIDLDGHRIAGPVDRAELGQALTLVAEQHPGPHRLRIREADGSVYVGSLPAAPSPTVSSPLVIPPPPSLPGGAVSDASQLFAVGGDGFVPGEDVALAVILRLSSAGPSGSARALVTGEEAPGGPGDVLLFGLTSGTVHRGTPTP
jgi:hypothetical protein